MKIGFLEIVLILAALIWVLGIFRKISESPKSSPPPYVPPANNQEQKPVKKPLYGDDGEFVEFEEIRE